MRVNIHRASSRDKAPSVDDIVNGMLGTVSDVYAPTEAEQIAEDKRKAAFNKKAGKTADAQPQVAPLYAGFPLSAMSEDALAGWAAANGFVLPYWPHVTVAYSKTPVDWRDAQRMSEGLVVPPGGRRIEQFGDDVVLCLECDALQKRWQHYRDLGASWDFPSYQPHVTLMRNTKLEPWMREQLVYDEPITLGPEKLDVIREKFHSVVEG